MQTQEHLVDKEELERAQESESYLRNRVAQLDKSLKEEKGLKEMLQNQVKNLLSGRIETDHAKGRVRGENGVYQWFRNETDGTAKGKGND